MTIYFDCPSDLYERTRTRAKAARPASTRSENPHPSVLYSANLETRIALCISFSIDLLLRSNMISVLVLLTAIVVVPVIGAITSSLQAILMNTHGSREYEYPTDITRDIYPVSY